MQEKLNGEYLDMCKGTQSEVISTTIFDENSDLSITWYGRVDMKRVSKIKVKEKFPILHYIFTLEILTFIT